LSKASGLALLSMTIIVTAVVIEAPQVDQELRGSDEETWTFVRPQIFQVGFYTIIQFLESNLFSNLFCNLLVDWYN